jgi:CO dehydrogenase maturation factor
MKIAFVGKGGSGKSTLTALFIRHLQQQGRNTLALDADLNMNLAGLLGVEFPQDRVLAAPPVTDAIRTHLKGKNERIPHISKFLPTTPPGEGSNLIHRYDDPALDFCSVEAGINTRLLTVGTYESEGIGQTCYHSHLFVAENLLSHTVADNFDVVCDMVAGTDAFAYSLHLQFDAIVLIAEPTPESAEVCALYMGLAKESGINSLVHLVANKVEDEDDLAFIRDRTGLAPLGAVPVMPVLKKSRQRGEPVKADMVPVSLMQVIENAARNPAVSEHERFTMFCRLHEKLNGKEWVKLAYGDVMGQIDEEFMKEKAA